MTYNQRHMQFIDRYRQQHNPQFKLQTCLEFSKTSPGTEQLEMCLENQHGQQCQQPYGDT